MRQEKQAGKLSGRQVRDSSGKLIFDDHLLCSQFLRDYVDLPYMKEVRPEDIEDVSEQFVPLFAPYLPDFQYYLVPLRAYGNEEFLERNDEMSLVMMMGKIQSVQDVDRFRELPAERARTRKERARAEEAGEPGCGRRAACRYGEETR